jgi:hypothetical protein
MNGKIIYRHELKISQYADDTCLFLSNEASVQTALFVFEIFSKCSRLCVNRDKSKSIWISASSNYQHNPFGLKWTQSATCLVIFNSNDLKDIIDTIFTARI